MHLTVEPALLNQSSSNSPPATLAWHEVARVCRRICLLRERDQLDDAEHLRATALVPLIAAREAESSPEEVARRLAEIFAAEQERVADAAALAELLLPILAQQLRDGFAPARAGPPAAPASTSPFTTLAAAPPPPAPTDIAGFIDQMIAQEDHAASRAS